MRGVYSLFSVLFFGLIGLVMIGGHNFGIESYEILDSATSDVTPVGTVELSRSPQSAEITTTFAKTPATEAKIRAQQVATTAKSTSVIKRNTATTKATAAPNSISIGGRTIRIKSVSDTTVNAGSIVAKYGDKFLYGHNTGAVFGHLASLGVGTTLTVTLGGQPTTYQITKAVTLEKNTQVVPIMYNIAQAQYRGQQYSLALMTCAGTPLPSQDATHRLIIFANQV